ncbi:MAG: hypothetical protein KJ886_00990 [Candidatus Thermoplasmatota archaeon]|nr:hypothetical protein [Candidatus Thermoplasmatota archaeon]
MKILVDAYEHKQIRDYLTKSGCKIEIKDLRKLGGDYHLIENSDTVSVIERKGIRDLILSTAQKEGRSVHLFDQLSKIKKYKLPIFIIEGITPKWSSDWDCISYGKDYRFHRNFIIGIQIWCMKNNIFPVRTESTDETVRFIVQLAKKLSQSNQDKNLVSRNFK